MKNKVFNFAYVMNYLIQTIWSLALPAGVIIGLGYFLWWKFSLDRWVMIVAIVLGVLCGVYSMFLYIVRMADYATGDFDPEKHSRRRNRK